MQGLVHPIGQPALLEIGRQTIEYFSSGDGNADPVILLPALGRSVAELNPLAERILAAGFRTIGIEIRGVGRSMSPLFPRTSLNNLAEDVIRIMDELSLEKAHLIGRALGNRIARVVSSRWPERVQSATLIAAGGHIRPKKKPGLRYLVSPKVRNQWLCAAGNEMPSELNRAPSLRSLLRQVPATKNPPPGKWWLGGKAPMLVIQGKADRIAPMENGLELKEHAPDRVELLTVEDAGHMVLHEQFETVSQAILNFLKKEGPPGSADVSR